MSNQLSWILTDVDTGLYVDSWSVTGEAVGVAAANNWSVRKRRLHGGRSDGVDVVEVDNGSLSFTVLPTRGMGLWRGSYRGARLGWDSPVRGPVHPSFVDQASRDGLGWLNGFDEWVVRCGLNSNGPPCQDEAGGSERALTLHGHIANTPAHHLEVRVDADPPHAIEIHGRVQESSLFGSHLEMRTLYRTTPGSATLELEDTIHNRLERPAEFELLYHCNFGRPFLSENAQFLAPIKQIAPRDGVAASEIDRFAIYGPPQQGFPEAVYWIEPLSDPDTNRTLAVLRNGAKDKACALRFSRAHLPWFVLWKNTGAEREGYVTGLEPTIDLPNPKPFERQEGRIVVLAPDSAYHTRIAFEVADTIEDVERLSAEVDALQTLAEPIIHREPQIHLSGQTQ